ncbi:Uncharacterized protein AXF42_Ash006160 [Apostasia shenzhenica]|uniref:Uncharacterized protein n=1 Tax=Apostasia shenzhenica TaxID=1088818 RepID=A0A2I0B0D5_9ASPA|nr:Uncharacterized protein AXF42_Ash006160 [Apostasia shenzhenica]
MGIGVGIASKMKSLFVLLSVKEKTPDEGKVVSSGLGYTFKDFGSKDIFFDSRAWLDSDCDDDYYSVNGEFTPSRGTTPNRQIGIGGYDDLFPNNISETTPTGKKKKLAELLQESLGEQPRSELPAIDKKVKDLGIPHVRTNGKSDAEFEVNQCQILPDEMPKSKKERMPVSCCMPSLVASISFRKQKNL